jgi:adenylate cyclase
VAPNPIQSAWLRFFRKFGVAFFWAAVLGVLFGGASYFRIDRSELEGDPRWHAVLRLWLERLEWITFDWRARELGAASERSDEVVIVAIDEETMVNTRESEHPAWAMSPWPRDLLGSVIEQVLREGAALVVLDTPVVDVSAHHRVDARKSDDELFAARLEKLGGKVVLGFDWQPLSRRPADRPLNPFLVKMGEFNDLDAALPLARRVLASRTTAYLFSSGRTQVLWGGATSEARARDLAAALDVKGALTTRSLTPADDEHELTREWLLTRLVSLEPKGVEVESLPQAGSLDGPVATLLLPQALAGAVRLLPNADGVLRAVPLLVATRDAQPRVLPSAVVQAALLLGGSRSVEQEGSRLTLAGRYTVPVDAEGLLALRWSDAEAGRGERGTMKRSVPAWRLLVNREDDDAGRGVRHHDNDLAGKVVVLTDSRREQRTWATPVGRLSRAAITAQALTNVLRGEGIARVRPQIDFWLTVAFAFVGGILAVVWSSLVRRPGWLAWVVTIVLVAALHAFIARQMFVTQGRQVAVVAPLLAFGSAFLASLGYARTLEQGLRDFVLRALGGAVRADVFRRVERDLKLMRPERRALTIYFSDIEGFTAVAQTQDPRQVVTVLQEYLSEMTTLVLDRAGHVDKYLGDGLMAFWGAPVALPESAATACAAALDMQARFEKLRPDWEARCGYPLLLRAGIDTGPTLVGEMGTMHRVNYTVMGEPVATAFRLEALAKKYDARILVGEALVAQAGAQFVFREVDTISLGRAGDLGRIYELLGRAEDLGDQQGWLAQYAQALEHWRARRFAEALELLKPLAVALPEDKLIARYVVRCERLVATPPPPDWNGLVGD